MQRWRIGTALATATFLGSGLVVAEGSDRSAAERLLAEVTRAPDAAAATRELSAARQALTRARQAGGTERAAMLEGLAKDWAENARVLLAARQAEAELIAAQEEANERADRLGHARILLEETVARRERAAHEQQRVEAETAPRSIEKKPTAAAAAKKKL